VEFKHKEKNLVLLFSTKEVHIAKKKKRLYPKKPRKIPSLGLICFVCRPFPSCLLSVVGKVMEFEQG